MQFHKEIRWWLESQSSLWHIGFIVLLYVLFGIAIFVALTLDFGAQASQQLCSVFTPTPCLDTFFDVFSGDAKRDYPTLTFAVGIGKPILTIIATSILTISLLRDTGRIVLSRSACVYEQATLEAEKSTIKDPCLVFRMMNRGGQLIFDVSVSVALRFVGIDNEQNVKTFRFFPLQVLGKDGEEGEYPLLEPRLPFRVYVRLEQEVQSAIYVGTLQYSPIRNGQSLAETLALIDRETKKQHSGNTDESAIVVSVRGKDSISGNEVVTSTEYRLSTIRSGKFADINLQQFQESRYNKRMDYFNRINDSAHDCLRPCSEDSNTCQLTSTDARSNS